MSDYGSRVCNYGNNCRNNRQGFDEYCPEHIRQTGWSRPCRAIDCEEKCARGVLLCQAHMDERSGTAKKEKEKEKVCIYCGGGNVERSAPGINPMQEGARDRWAHDQGHTAAAGCILELAKRVKALEDAMEGLDSSFRASTRTLSAILNSSPVGRRAAILATRAKRHEKEDKNNPGS